MQEAIGVIYADTEKGIKTGTRHAVQTAQEDVARLLANARAESEASVNKQLEELETEEADEIAGAVEVAERADAEARRKANAELERQLSREKEEQATASMNQEIKKRIAKCRADIMAEAHMDAKNKHEAAVKDADKKANELYEKEASKTDERAKRRAKDAVTYVHEVDYVMARQAEEAVRRKIKEARKKRKNQSRKQLRKRTKQMI